MTTKLYNRIKSADYATFWAFKRNPEYYNFDNLGGDCTNFVSQCLFNGAPSMNYTPTFGWFYNSLNNRTPAWSGVNELYSFLINNEGLGPFGKEVSIELVGLGDIIQLGRQSNDFYHTLIVSKVVDGRIYVCSHTRDVQNLPLEYYSTRHVRFIKIFGYRI